MPGPGRPSFKPTEKDRNLVKTMAAGGFDQELIARCIGIEAKTLRAHFREELDVSMAMANAEAVGQLQAAIKRGEAWAICFRLKCRAGWKDASRVEHSGVNGGPIETADVSGYELLLSRINSLATRKSKGTDSQRAD